jgi:hypothetical protein
MFVQFVNCTNVVSCWLLHEKWNEHWPFHQSAQLSLRPHLASLNPHRNAISCNSIPMLSLCAQEIWCLSNQQVKYLGLNT